MAVVRRFRRVGVGDAPPGGYSNIPGYVPPPAPAGFFDAYNDMVAKAAAVRVAEAAHPVYESVIAPGSRAEDVAALVEAAKQGVYLENAAGNSDAIETAYRNDQVAQRDAEGSHFRNFDDPSSYGPIGTGLAPIISNAAGEVAAKVVTAKDAAISAKSIKDAGGVFDAQPAVDAFAHVNPGSQGAGSPILPGGGSSLEYGSGGGDPWGSGDAASAPVDDGGLSLSSPVVLGGLALVAAGLLFMGKRKRA